MRSTDILLLAAGLVAAQNASSASSAFLVGANTEPGSAQKEGISGWKDASKVKTVLQRDFGLVQTTAYPTWGAWTGSGMDNVAFDIAGANEVINWAESQGKKSVVHLLTGSPTYFPTWLCGGTWSASQLEALQDRWITYAMTSNGNAQKVDYWNVVNEAFMWNGDYWDSSSVANTNPWHRMGWEDDKSGLTGATKVYAQHPVYIRRAFEMARKHTSAKLELRDYGIEFWDGSRKSKAFYQLVKHLVNSGTPIDAVGFQGHFRTDRDYSWAKLTRAVQEYKKLGLEVYITEVDYGDDDPVAASTTAHRTPAWDSLQADNYRAFASAAVAGGANWICLWGVADNTNDYWRKGQSALLYDESYTAKRTYDLFHQGIAEGLATASVERRSPSASLTGALGNGRIRIDLDAPENVRLQIRGLDGSLLDQRELGNLSAGTHAIDLGRSGSARIVLASTAHRSHSFLLGAD